MNRYEIAINELKSIIDDGSINSYKTMRRRAETVLERVLPAYVATHWNPSAHFKFDSKHKTNGQRILKVRLAIRDAIHALDVANKLDAKRLKEGSFVNQAKWYRKPKYVIPVVGILVSIGIAIYSQSGNEVEKSPGRDQTIDGDHVNITNIYGDTSEKVNYIEKRLGKTSPPVIDLCKEYGFRRTGILGIGDGKAVGIYLLNICGFGSSAHKVRIKYYIMMRKRMYDYDFVMPVSVNDSSKLRINKDVIQKSEETRTQFTILYEHYDDPSILAYYVASKGTILDDDGVLHNVFTMKKFDPKMLQSLSLDDWEMQQVKDYVNVFHAD